MRYIILFVVLLAAAVNAQIIDPHLMSQMRTTVTECVIKTGVNIGEMNQILGNQVPNEKQSCFLACALKKLNAMDGNNKIQAETIKKILEIVKSKDLNKFNQISQVIDTCVNKQGTPDSNECTAAANFKKCLIDNGKI